MKGLIVLDGPDGAGKTTLAKRLCEKYGGRYLHLTYRWKSSMFEYHTAALHHALSMSEKQLVIIDRLWMSELVYSTVYRNHSDWPHMGRMLDRVIRKHAGMYILCFDESMKSHQDRFMKLKAERVEMYHDTTDVWAMYHSLYYGGIGDLDYGNDYFEDLTKKEGLQKRGDVWKYSIDNEGRDIEGFINRFMTCFQLRQGEQIDLGLDPKFTNLLGYPAEAKYLFIGDRLSEKKYKSLGWPFYQYSDCSLYITKQLSRMGFDETLACWTNANEHMGMEVVYLLCHYYKLKPIFFGLQSMSKFKNDDDVANQTLGLIRHPQFYRRWRHNTDDFINDLTEVLELPS